VVLLGDAMGLAIVALFNDAAGAHTKVFGPEAVNWVELPLHIAVLLLVVIAAMVFTVTNTVPVAEQPLAVPVTV
jgi:hypothetical protein